MKNIKTILKMVITFMVLIGLYVSVLMLAFSFPERNLVIHYQEAVEIINTEGMYPTGFLQTAGSTLDNFTDQLMMQKTIVSGKNSALYEALFTGGYTRYWNGYITFLRPLLVVFDYLTIRKMVALTATILFLISLLAVHKRFATKIAIAYAVTWAAFYSMLVCSSLQFLSVNIIMYLAILFICVRYKKDTNCRELPFFFLVLGSVTNFFDLLTFPLVTFTVPFILVFLVDLYEKKLAQKNIARNFMVSGGAWCIGYAATWISKWLISGIILKMNVFADAMSQAAFRINGDAEWVVDRKRLLLYNINTPAMLRWFTSSGWLWLLLIIVVSVQKRWKNIRNLWPLLLIAILPYVWYMVFANHSQVHFFFTNRTQYGTLMAILVMFAQSIDFSFLQKRK